MKNKGFTLVELLVVISIIAMLLSVLIPALSKARAQGKAVVCKNNLHQIGLAVNLYANSNDNYIHRGNWDAILTSLAPPYPKAYLWFTAYTPYLGNIKSGFGGVKYLDTPVFRCPSYPDVKQTVCYVINAFGIRASAISNYIEVQNPTKIFDFKEPCNKIYLCDNEDPTQCPGREIIEDLTVDYRRLYHNDVWTWQHLWYHGHGSAKDKQWRNAIKRHRDGSNALFIDGHTDYVSANDNRVDKWEP